MKKEMIFEKLIDEMITQKVDLKIIIEELIFDDTSKPLTTKDLDIINALREEINTISQVIDDLLASI